MKSRKIFIASSLYLLACAAVFLPPLGAQETEFIGNVVITANSTSGMPFTIWEDSAVAYMAWLIHDGNNANRHGIIIQAGADNGNGTTTYIYGMDGDQTQIGHISNVNNTFALYTVSDERLKKDIAPTRVDGLSVIDGIGLFEYRFKDHPAGAPLKRIGFIAQDLEAVFPEMVVEIESLGDPTTVKSVAPAHLIPVLVKAVQELNAKNEALEARIAALEARANGL